MAFVPLNCYSEIYKCLPLVWVGQWLLYRPLRAWTSVLFLRVYTDISGPHVVTHSAQRKPSVYITKAQASSGRQH